MASQHYPKFRAIEYQRIGQMRVVVTALDRDCADFSHLEGQIVDVDGVRFRCISVIERPESLNYKRGARISLAIEAMPAEG